jgi:hypothetical protein
VGTTQNLLVNNTSEVIVITPTCNTLNVDPVTGVSPLNSTFTCNASYADTYKIEIRDSS